MACVSLKVQIVNSILTVKVEAVNNISTYTEGYDENIAVVTAVPRSIKVAVSPICSTHVGRLYLEIEPEILWVYPEFDNTNNVYSNTNWNVN